MAPITGRLWIMRWTPPMLTTHGTLCLPSASFRHGLQGYFAAGGAPYADMVDFHGYVGSQMPEAGLANLSTIKQLAVQYGLSSKPLQDTEAYWWTITDTTAQTAWLARHYLLEASQ